MYAGVDDVIVLCGRVHMTACPPELMTSLFCVAEFMGLVGGGDERIGAGEEAQ